MPGGWKSASNPREDFPRSELFALNLRHVYARWGKSAPNLREDFPRSELFALNLRHVYAQWGEICLESEARFSEVGMVSPRSGAEK